MDAKLISNAMKSLSIEKKVEKFQVLLHLLVFTAGLPVYACQATWLLHLNMNKFQ